MRRRPFWYKFQAQLLPGLVKNVVETDILDKSKRSSMIFLKKEQRMKKHRKLIFFFTCLVHIKEEKEYTSQKENTLHALSLR